MRGTLLFMFSVVGCSSTEDKATSGSEASFDQATADTGRWADGGEGADSYVMPTRWTLSGSMVIADQVLDTDLSALRASVEDDQGASLCWEGASMAEAVRAEESPDTDVDAWWQVRLLTDDGSACASAGIDSPFPESLGIGLGPLHEEIEAVLGSELGDAPPGDQQVRSVFAALGDQGPIWVFGVATNDAEVEPGPIGGDLSDAVVTDGQWKFTAIYPFPYGD